MTKRKIKVETDNSNWQEPTKVRKPRKPMTKKQRAAAAKRLEKARKVRAAKNPNYGQSGIHPSLHNLPDDHFAHPKKVKQWINTQQGLANAEHRAVREKVKGALARQLIHKGYVREMKRYLKTGDWGDMFYGEYQEKKIKIRCIAMAYDKDGTPKREVDVYYPDMGCVYTKEMLEEDRERINA